MNTCLCGNAVKQEGASCERCSALQILGLDPGATSKQVESAYRLLVKVWHPDRFQNDAKLRDAAEEKLKNINAAHAYLESAPDPEPRRRAPKRPVPQETTMQPGVQTRRPTWLNATLASGIPLRCLIVLAGLAVPAILLMGLDGWLASNPTTAGFYRPYRDRVLFDLRTNMTTARQTFAQSFHHGVPADGGGSPDPSSQPATPSETEKTDSAPETTVPVPSVPMPYVTVGLTTGEVETVMGSPVSASGETLRYRNAIFYLRNGRVAGWKVDAALIPLRVKLWPSGHPDPHVTTFAIGSARNDVIAVQGTPTVLAENKLGYGASEVFLERGRVIGWNDSHTSERLHVAPH